MNANIVNTCMKSGREAGRECYNGLTRGVWGVADLTSCLTKAMNHLQIKVTITIIIIIIIIIVIIMIIIITTIIIMIIGNF